MNETFKKYIKYKPIEKTKEATYPKWDFDTLVFSQENAIPFEIEKFDDSEAGLEEFKKKIPGLTKENPSILNIKDMKEDPLYPGLKKHIGEVINVENMFYNIKWIKIVEE